MRSRAHDRNVAPRKFEARYVQKPRGALGDADHVVHVEHDARSLCRHAIHPANDVPRAVDADEPVHAEILDAMSALAQHRSRRWRTLHARRRNGGGVHPTQGHRRITGARERVEAEVARQPFARRDAAHAVALAIQPRGEDADPEAS
jgi:hypothetical protein